MHDEESIRASGNVGVRIVARICVCQKLSASRACLRALLPG